HRVDRGIAEKLDRVLAAQVQIHHMVCLVKEHGAVLPRPLLAAPVTEFRRDHRVDVGAELRVAQHLHGISGGRQDFFQIARAHYSSPVAGSRIISHFVCNTNESPGAAPAWRRARTCPGEGVRAGACAYGGFAITTFPNSSPED